MQVEHPLAARDAPCPAAVTGPDGQSYPVVDGVIDCPDSVAAELADALARAYGEPPDDLVYEEDGPDDDDRCQTVKQDGEVCGREKPCPYHSDDDSDGTEEV